MSFDGPQTAFITQSVAFFVGSKPDSLKSLISMPRSYYQMELANLICRFGSKLALVDGFKEVVWPAFSNESLERKYDDTRYFFYQVNRLEFKDPTNETISMVYGRFIKDTVVRREQIFSRDSGLVPSRMKMPSAPSSFFVLILNNHRLLYVKETQDGPSLSSFKSTLQKFIQQSHKSWLKAEMENNKRAREKDSGLPALKKADFLANLPHPTLEIVPLASGESIRAFLAKYTLLKSLEIRLVDPNHEIDNDDFFDILRKKKDTMGSKTTSVKHVNNTEGLAKEEAAAEVEQVATKGNHTIKLSGLDEIGDRLNATNDKFNIKVQLSELPTVLATRAQRMYVAFAGLVDRGIIRVDKTSAAVRNFINNLTSTNESDGRN